MVDINLLPKWQIIPIKSIVFTLGALVIILFLHLQCRIAMIEKQEKISLLKKEIHNIESEIAILSPKNSRFVSAKHTKNMNLCGLLKKLPHMIPMGLYLTELSMGKNHYKLVGYAEKTTLISEFATELTHLRFDVSLQQMLMEKEPDDFPIKFCLSVKPI